MQIAKIVNKGCSEVVLLPKAFNFDCDEVYVKRTSKGVLLIPKSNNIWDEWAQSLMKYDDDFMSDRE